MGLSSLLHENQCMKLISFLDLFKLHSQKQDTFSRPLIDIMAKEGKDKKVMFEAGFTKPNAKPKWFLRKDVSVCLILVQDS